MDAEVNLPYTIHHISLYKHIKPTLEQSLNSYLLKNQQLMIKWNPSFNFDWMGTETE